MPLPRGTGRRAGRRRPPPPPPGDVKHSMPVMHMAGPARPRPTAVVVFVGRGARPISTWPPMQSSRRAGRGGGTGKSAIYS